MMAQAGPLRARTAQTAPAGDSAVLSLIEARKYPEAETILRGRLRAHEAAGTMATAAAAGDGETLAFLLTMTKRAE